ncbi:MAG TPA: hypothetical protein VF661_16905 [Actinomycetales bacterium]|jgi:hypothetical protein
MSSSLTKRGAWRAAVAVTAAAAVVGGVSASTPGAEASGKGATDHFTSVATSHQYAIQRGWTAQAAALADGVVTGAEQLAAYRAYASCVMAFGNFTLSEPVRSPIDDVTLTSPWVPAAAFERLQQELQVQQFAVSAQETPDASVDPAHHCQRTHYDLVDQAYKETHQPVMAEPLLTRVRECLTAKHLDFDPAADDLSGWLPGELVHDVSRTDVVYTCVTETTFAMYPDIGQIGLGT